MRFLAAVFAFICLIVPAGLSLGGSAALAAPDFPALTGRVVDDAHILNSETRDGLDEKLAALEAKTSRQLVVVTIPSLGGYEISDYGYQLGRAWGIGQKKLNNGVLLIVAPNDHRVRIEVGYGLEPVITDALSSVIIQTQITPKFRQGDFNGGVMAGADALIQQLSLDPSEAEKRAAEAEQARQQDGGNKPDPIGVLIAIVIIGFAIARVFGGWGFLPFLFMGGPRGGGGWSGGGGGWSGGGGFGGGGGGSFGGGGASGSW